MLLMIVGRGMTLLMCLNSVTEKREKETKAIQEERVGQRATLACTAQQNKPHNNATYVGNHGVAKTVATSASVANKMPNQINRRRVALLLLLEEGGGDAAAAAAVKRKEEELRV